MNIKLLIDGGDMKPGPAIAQQLGPLGINIGKVISYVNASTTNFKGMKVPVELDVNEKTKEFTVKTFSPPTSELLKKEISLEKGTKDHKKIKVGNASIEDVIKITKIKFPDMLQKEFKSAVKSVLGTCASIGILVENQEANGLIHNLDKFEKQINEQIIETSPEKRKKLNAYFAEVKRKQDELIAREQAEAGEAEKAKEEAVKAAATTEEGKPVEEKKPEKGMAEEVKEEVAEAPGSPKKRRKINFSKSL